MNSFSSYRDLVVWQKSMAMAVNIYTVTRTYPMDERFGITSQMRRAATSIPANIAEGQARRTTGEFLNTLSIARGSLAELETFVILSERLGFLPESASEEVRTDCAEINKMLQALARSFSTS